MRKIQYVLFFLLILLLPSQLGKHWWPLWSLVNGIRLDYLSPTIYLTDLLLIGVGILMCRRIRGIRWKNSRNLKILGVLGVWGAWIIFRAERPMLAMYWLAKYLEIAVMAGITAWGVRGVWGSKESASWRRGTEAIRKALAIGVVFLVGLEIAQIILGRTTGWFWILGERNFNISTPGISTIAVWGKEILRPYATFGHPNALAGYLAVAGAMFGHVIPLSGKRGCEKKLLSVKVISFLGVILTASRVAIVAAALGYLGVFGIFGAIGRAEKTGSLILFAPRAIEERVVLNKAGWKMFRANWLWGVGPGQFLIQLPKYLPASERNLQPVHNVFLLLLTEFGVIGGGIGVIGLIWLIRKTKKVGPPRFCSAKPSRVKGFWGVGAVILITAMFDHYWVTSQQNRLLLGLVIGLILVNSKHKIRNSKQSILKTENQKLK